jgi:YegS/Rv2252/BmrU family lipid kinase
MQKNNEKNIETAPEKKKALLIVNPCSGKNATRSGTLDIVERFSSADYDFVVKSTTGPGDATEFVEKFIDGNDMVVCCGGDGTFNETINGVMKLPRRVPIGYIPAGSTNDLASTIGLPKDTGKATDIIIEGHKNAYDIGLFNNRFFAYIASFGAATSLSYSTPQKLKNLFGHSAYVINGLVINLIPTLKALKPIHARIEYDDNVLEDDFYFGSVSNSTSVGGVFKFDRDDVKLDDGKFEVLLVRNLKSPLESFALLNKVRRKQYDGEKIIYFKASTIRFTFDKDIPWTLDGEFGGDQREVYCAVLNRAIDIFSPENQIFLGNKIDIPVFDVADANSEEAKKEDPRIRFTRFRRKKRVSEEEEAPAAEEKEETAEPAPEEETASAQETPAEEETTTQE